MELCHHRRILLYKVPLCRVSRLNHNCVFGLRELYAGLFGGNQLKLITGSRSQQSDGGFAWILIFLIIVCVKCL